MIITDVLAGMDISTGNEVAAHRWELLPEAAPYAFVAPPEKKFVGSVGLVAELRLANDKIVDRQPVYLEWAPPSPPGPAENQYNREEPAGPNRRLEDDPDREKAAAVSSSTPSAPDGVARQELMSSSTSPVESDPDRRKRAGLSSATSSAADGIARQEATASSTRPAESDPDRERRRRYRAQLRPHRNGKSRRPHPPHGLRPTPIGKRGGDSSSTSRPPESQEVTASSSPTGCE